MSIRDAVEADLPAILAIYNAAVPELVTGDLAPISIESLAVWFAGHSSDHHPVWVSTDGQRVTGWLSLGTFYEKPVYTATAEVSVYVERASRNKGVARALIRFAIERGPDLVLKHLIGLIYADNGPSLHLFEEMGFERWGLLPRVTDRGDSEIDVAIVGRRVGSD
jgi:L-amino acid N-acyltransferase YncA